MADLVCMLELGHLTQYWSSVVNISLSSGYWRRLRQLRRWEYCLLLTRYNNTGHFQQLYRIIACQTDEKSSSEECSDNDMEEEEEETDSDKFVEKADLSNVIKVSKIRDDIKTDVETKIETQKTSRWASIR